MKIKVFSDWNYHLDADFEEPVELYIDKGCRQYDSSSKAIKILMLWEPPQLFPDICFDIFEDASKYDFILTYYDKVLDNFKHSYKYMWSTSWIKDDYQVKEKIFGISTLIGYKRITNGHVLRHELYEKRQNIKIPNYFYLSQHGGHPDIKVDEVFSMFRKQMILRESKEPLFDYQFHIVIENVKMKNMFTEKLTDTCKTMTIPIYWGCTNIEEFYDTRGMFICNNVDEIIDVCNSIKPDTYQSMLPYAQINREKSFQYSHGEQDLINVIEDIVKKTQNMKKESEYKYNSWPIGKLPKEWQRPELDMIKEKGYEWNDPRDVIDIFEKKVAQFAGSKYAVSCDCCSNGIFLCIKYLQSIKEISVKQTLKIPSRTYISVPMQILHAGCQVSFEDIEWSGQYQIKNTRIWDSAVRFTKGMYVGEDALQVMSFQLKKRVPIGKGGIILTDSEEAYNWLKLASYDGRNLKLPYTDQNHFKMIGYHMYMTPEDAARGILLMDRVPEINEDSGNNFSYTDVSSYFSKNSFIPNNDDAQVDEKITEKEKEKENENQEEQ